MRIILSTLLLVSGLLEYLEYTKIFQLADYRVDRTKDYFFARDGFKNLSKIHWVWKILAVWFALLFPYFEATVLIVLILDILYRFFVTFKNTKPKFTLRSTSTLILPTLVETFLFFWFFPNPSIITFLILRPFVFTLSSLALWPLFKLLAKHYIKKATTKLSTYKNLKSIGITGSYGKTSVKVLLSEILSNKFKVIHTPKNINTELGIAQFILKTDFNKYDIFIAEMGAYGRGEVEIMTKMVKPEIGILTTIIEQHLALFKTVKNIQLAKFELLQSIPERGVSITNSDNFYCREMLKTIKSKVMTFGSMDKFEPTCLIKDAKQNTDNLNFNLKIEEDEEWNIQTKLLGVHQAYNIAPCVLTAKHLGMNKKDIISACARLKAPERTLKAFSYGKSIIIDDSYNANPVGFKAGLKVLASLGKNKKKIVVARGMFELGTKTKQKHKEIGKDISKFADELILTTENPGKLFELGVEKDKTPVLYKLTNENIWEFLQKNKEENNIILIEHRLPDEIYEKLLKEIKEL
jgi:UDP-N-acetylmuramoyl-tripeptide--D-alanyl-D-alanine ligase